MEFVSEVCNLSELPGANILCLSAHRSLKTKLTSFISHTNTLVSGLAAVQVLFRVENEI